jgi:hypothetical protein
MNEMPKEGRKRAQRKERLASALSQLVVHSITIQDIEQ